MTGYQTGTQEPLYLRMPFLVASATTLGDPDRTQAQPAFGKSSLSRVKHIHEVRQDQRKSLQYWWVAFENKKGHCEIRLLYQEKNRANLFSLFLNARGITTKQKIH